MEVDDEVIDVAIPVKKQTGGGELEKYYNYLKSKGADVPDSFQSFSNTLSDEQQAKKYYQYVRQKGYDAPPTFESFSSTFGLKKKRYRTGFTTRFKDYCFSIKEWWAIRPRF